jgi:hypothetical protein
MKVLTDAVRDSDIGLMEAMNEAAQETLKQNGPPTDEA